MNEYYLYGIIIILLFISYNFYLEARALRIFADEIRDKKLKDLKTDESQKEPEQKRTRELNPDC